VTGASPDPTAKTITIAQTLELLDGPHAAVADAVTRGSYVFWLGSGISRGRVDGLDGVIVRVLEFLQDKAALEGSDSPHRRALEGAIELAGLSPDQIPTVDASTPVASWSEPDRAALITNLTEKYADLLDLGVDGKPADYLLWDGVNVRSTYASGAAPDCEHLAIAVLVLEGVVTEAPSANWDGLVEAALAELGAPATVTDVVVLPEELRDTHGILRLIKFHGCAIRAADDPDTYREALIGRASQISDWAQSNEAAAIRNELISLATTKRTLMIGLSAQDENIKAVFSAARARMAWHWPSNPPANVFGSDRLGHDHLTILRMVYRDDFTGNEEAIRASALIRAYGAQLLTALVLQVALAKLRAFLRECDAPHLADDDFDALELNLRDLRDQSAAHADNDRLAFMRTLWSTQTRALALFRRGEEPTPGGIRYEAFGNQPVNQIPGAAGLETTGMRELAAGLSLIGRTASATGSVIGLSASAGGHSGIMRIAGSVGESAVFFAANPQAGVQLEVSGIVPADAKNVVVVHSSGPVPQLKRSPGGRFGRTGRAGPRHVDMFKLLREATDLSQLERSFREEAAL
jgi:hypothetical protein